MTADPTVKDKVRGTRPVHRRTTRANPNPIQLGPLPTIWEDGGMTTPTNKPTDGGHRPWPTRTVNGEKIGAKKNNVRHASLKKIEKLINRQRVKDGKQAVQMEISARAARARKRAEQKLAQAQQEAQSRQREVQQPATPTIPLHEHGDHPTQTSREQTTLQAEAEALERL